MYVMKWCNPRRFKQDCETQKRPSALAFDEMNIHVKGWVIIKNKCVKVNEWGDNMILD